MLTGTFVRPLTAYHVISVCRFRSLPAKVSHLDIWIPSDSNSRWTPCLWLTLPAAERVVVSRHLVVAHAERTNEKTLLQMVFILQQRLFFRTAYVF